MMKVMKCENGHYFDVEKYTSCPHCEKLHAATDTISANSIQSNIQRNTIQSTAMDDLMHTVAIAADLEETAASLKSKEAVDEEATMSLYAEIKHEKDEHVNSKEMRKDGTTDLIKETTEIAHEKKDVLVLPRQKTDLIEESASTPKMPPEIRPHIEPDDDGKTQVLNGSYSDPTIGFLVAIKGPHFGEGFPIYEGKNAIGRQVGNRIQLNKDRTISRRAQLFIVFDSIHTRFFAVTGESDAVAYINDELLLQPQELKERDQIKVGNTTLLFIPVLRDDYTWDLYAKGLESI